MRVIVAGSRGLSNIVTNLEIIEESLMHWAGAGVVVEEIVSGGCRDSPDEAGEAWARAHGVPVRLFLPDWGVGRSAGPRRNRQMAEYGTHLIAIWDGLSRGTRNMIEEMRKLGKPVAIATVGEEVEP